MRVTPLNPTSSLNLEGDLRLQSHKRITPYGRGIMSAPGVRISHMLQLQGLGLSGARKV